MPTRGFREGNSSRKPEHNSGPGYRPEVEGIVSPTTPDWLKLVPGLQFMPGDIIAFAGNGRVSQFIAHVTCSHYSHVGMCATFDRRTLLIESTTLNTLPCEITGKTIKGVQGHTPVTSIQAYDGHVWLLRLQPEWVLNTAEASELSRFLRSFIGREYDKKGAVLSPLRNLISCFRQDNHTVFCSEVVAGALMRIQRLELTAAQRFTPGGLINRLLYLNFYQDPIKLK